MLDALFPPVSEHNFEEICNFSFVKSSVAIQIKLLYLLVHIIISCVEIGVNFWHNFLHESEHLSVA